jgi:hypothetical protein
MKPVSVLFARDDSVYKTLPGCDVWDMARDARLWPGGTSVVAHPDCGPWAKLSQFCKLPEERKALAPLAVELVREWGGVLEHPAESKLWAHCGMPRPGRAPDWFGGWTAEIRQCDWGHPAEKLTWLYIVGVHPDDLPDLPPPGEATGLVKPRRGVPRDGRKIITKKWREATPQPMAEWLAEVARRAKKP